MEPGQIASPDSGPPAPRSFDPTYTFLGGVQVFNAQSNLNSITESVHIYTRIGVVGEYHGRHFRDADIRKPICAVAIPDRDIVAVIHNGRLISLFNCSTGKIVETFVVRDPPNFPPTRGLRGELVADSYSNLYITSEGAVSILRFNFTEVRDPTNVQPQVFATIPDTQRYKCFRGMAISLGRRLFFTAFGREIFGYNLADGRLTHRWDLGSDDLQSALVQSAYDMHVAPGMAPRVFLVATTLGGSKIHGKVLNFENDPDISPFQQIGRDIVGGLGQVRHCAFDKVGNLICADSKRRLIHIFPPTIDGSVVSIAPYEDDETTGEWIYDLKNETVDRLFNPSGVAVLTDPLSQRLYPMIVVPDFTLDALVFFALHPASA